VQWISTQAPRRLTVNLNRKFFMFPCTEQINVLDEVPSLPGPGCHGRRFSSRSGRPSMYRDSTQSLAVLRAILSLSLAVGIVLGCQGAAPQTSRSADGHFPESEGDAGSSAESRSAVASGDSGSPERQPAADESDFSVLVEMGECTTDFDCGAHCCGCETHPVVCDRGYCVFGDIEICADSSCCFFDNYYGCNSRCELDSPWPGYDGTCAGVDCTELLPDPAAAPLSPLHGCCTTGEDPAVSDPGVHCGVDGRVADAPDVGKCVQLGRPGSPDDACPAQVLRELSTEALAGCCTSQGRCGVLHDVLGCTYPGLIPGEPCFN